MRVLLTAALVALASSALGVPAMAQVATYDNGSIYDLDPPAIQSTGGRQLEQVFGTVNMEPIRDLHEEDVLRMAAKSVGRLVRKTTQGPIAFCTASVIADDLILTNHHCAVDTEAATLWMGYLVPRSRRGVASYQVQFPPVEMDEALDYAILRVHGNVGREWGTVALGLREAKPRQSLFVIHHPGGHEQHITLGGCRASDPALDQGDLLHTCDTLPGSSGAPIFDMRTRTVIGLHYSALSLRELNAAKPLTEVAAMSETLAGLVQEVVTDASPATAVRQPVPAEPAGPDVDEAGRVWAGLQDTRSIRALEFFASQYEGTVYAVLAAERIELLQTEREDPPAPASEAASADPADVRPAEDTLTPDEPAVAEPAAAEEAVAAAPRDDPAEAAARTDVEPEATRVAALAPATLDATGSQSASRSTIGTAAATSSATGSQSSARDTVSTGTRVTADATRRTETAVLSPDAATGNTFKGWHVHDTVDPTQGKKCYALAGPSTKSPPGVAHGDVWAFVSSFKALGSRDNPTFTFGLDLLAGSLVTASVDGAEAFNLATSGKYAWFASPSDATKLALAMRRGREMRVVSRAADGTIAAYTFPLTGLTAALNEVAERCA